MEPPIVELVQAGLLPPLVGFLQLNQSEEIVYEAVWTLTNIMSGPSDLVKEALNLGALAKLVALLKFSERVQEQVIWSLGNIAGDSVAHRDMVLASGALPHLVQALQKDKQRVAIMRNTVWTISNLHRGSPAPNFAQVSHTLKLLYDCLNLPD